MARLKSILRSPGPPFQLANGSNPVEPVLQSTVNQEITKLTTQLLAADSHDIYHEIVSAVQRRTVEIALEHCQGNQVHAAKILGITRVTLRLKRATRTK